MHRKIPIGILLALGLLVCGSGCARKPAVVNEVVAVPAATPEDPQDRAWNSAPEHVATLLLQDLVEPRLMTPSTTQLRVRALTDGATIAFRLQWTDATEDAQAEPGRHVDACAVQIPLQVGGQPPAPQMGELGSGVEIVYWRADWQAWADGRQDDIRSIYPHAAVDHYPFQAPPLASKPDAQREMAMRFAPPEFLATRRLGPRKSPVEDLMAEGPGSLSPAKQNTSTGKGIRTKDGWLVVLKRRLPHGLAAGSRTQVAFAVWEGSHGEVGARKMRTGWIPLLRRGQ